MASRKAVYLIALLAVAAIAAMWWANGAELEDAWLYIAAVGVVIASAPIADPKGGRRAHKK